MGKIYGLKKSKMRGFLPFFFIMGLDLCLGASVVSYAVGSSGVYLVCVYGMWTGRSEEWSVEYRRHVFAG